MPNPVRFPSGISNRGTRHMLSFLPILDPSKIFSWFDDFAGYTIGTATTAGWFSTAATGTLAAQVTGANGLVAQTPQAAAMERIRLKAEMVQIPLRVVMGLIPLR